MKPCWRSVKLSSRMQKGRGERGMWMGELENGRGGVSVVEGRTAGAVYSREETWPAYFIPRRMS